MRFGNGLVYIGSEWADFVASPALVGGKNTQSLHVHLKEGIDAHCARARAAGAVILQEPTDEFYGDRTSFSCRDSKLEAVVKRGSILGKAAAA